jgi:hypothetical protein
MSIIWLAWAWFFSGDIRSRKKAVREATNSLLSDHCFETLAELTSRRFLSPPVRAGGIAKLIARANHRTSLLHIPILPVRERLHTTLPIAPAGKVRWAERHDGKRDLYFQHAT